MCHSSFRLMLPETNIPKYSGILISDDTNTLTSSYISVTFEKLYNHRKHLLICSSNIKCHSRKCPSGSIFLHKWRPCCWVRNELQEMLLFEKRIFWRYIERYILCIKCICLYQVQLWSVWYFLVSVSLTAYDSVYNMFYHHSMATWNSFCYTSYWTEFNYRWSTMIYHLLKKINTCQHCTF